MARKSNGPRCGAKTKKGGTCQGVALENGRCRLHGGTASKRATVRRPAWSIARGLYTDGLHEEEMDIYGSVEIGTLELELKFLRVQLRRIVMAQKAYEEIHDRLAGEDWETMDTCGVFSNMTALRGLRRRAKMRVNMSLRRRFGR
jgi:hypothetical protein